MYIHVLNMICPLFSLIKGHGVFYSACIYKLKMNGILIMLAHENIISCTQCY